MGEAVFISESLCRLSTRPIDVYLGIIKLVPYYAIASRTLRAIISMYYDAYKYDITTRRLTRPAFLSSLISAHGDRAGLFMIYLRRA